MKDQDIIKAIAELDGWNKTTNSEIGLYISSDQSRFVWELPNYLHSRDAIIPVIEKQSRSVQVQFIDFLQNTVNTEYDGSDYCDIHAAILLMLATPPQLCEALLRATRKWKE